jgi:hypothetical protein
MIGVRTAPKATEIAGGQRQAREKYRYLQG